MSSISFSPAKDAELAWVDGQIHFSAPTARELTQNGGKTPSEGEDSKEVNIIVPILDALTSVEARKGGGWKISLLGSHFPHKDLCN